MIEELFESVRSVCKDPDHYSSESAFQHYLADSLGECFRELRMTFADPPLPVPIPPDEDVVDAARRGFTLSRIPKDPCDGRSRKLDILWRGVPVELKSITDIKSDVDGYQFLKDIHRLERLQSCESHNDLSPTRFAVFVSRDERCWTKWMSSAPEVYDGVHLPQGHLVQYRQPSPRTRWHDYPPFHLVDSYSFIWASLSHGAKCLIVPVRKAAM